MLSQENSDKGESNKASCSSSQVGRYTCMEPGCGKTFLRKVYLRRHILNHSSITEFVCKLCGKRFARKDLFSRHEKRHENGMWYRKSGILKRRSKENLGADIHEKEDLAYTTLDNNNIRSDISGKLSDTVCGSSTYFGDSVSSNDLNDQTSPKRDMLETIDLGYSTNNEHNTLGIMKKLKSVDIYFNDNLPDSKYSADYLNLIRQLPAIDLIDNLVNIFFSVVNWQYDIIDEVGFRNDLIIWRNISYQSLKLGPSQLLPDIRVFPALLFQVLAQALLYLPVPADEKLEALKYTASMTYLDRAIEFCDASTSILSLLGKSNITLSTIQTGLLTTSFLKSTGKVIEAWHVLGQTIRNGQEIGLHNNNRMDHEKTEQAQWHNEWSRRLWLMLYIWDHHMAVVLGRPSSTSIHSSFFKLPRDVCKRQYGIVPVQRNSEDPPTPFSLILAAYHTSFRFLEDINKLDIDSVVASGDYSTIEDLHNIILKNIENLPSWCRLENRLEKFDKMQGCHWIPAWCEGLCSSINFIFLALHRPFIFTSPNSRRRALVACLAILRSQTKLFQLSGHRQYMVFNMVFASFDAIVVLTSIYTIYPMENGEYLDDSIFHIEAGLNRLQKIGQYNTLAESAAKIVETLWTLLQNRRYNIQLSSTPQVNDNDFSQNRLQDSDLSSITPPYPFRDIFSENLCAVGINNNFLMNSLDDNSNIGDQITNNRIGRFQGDYSETSFWNFLNELI